MISYLIGIVKSPNEKYFTLLTNAGVGYKVFSNLQNLLSLIPEQKIEMLIHTIVKDDAIDLYGFTNSEELFMFEKLISVNGVGPRSALNILSASSVNSLANAIENNDLSILPSVPGVGKKSLEKIVIELKGKLAHLTKNNTHNKNTEEADSRLALTSLGYNDKDITNAINEVKKEREEKFETLQVNEIIKHALKYLR